MEIVVNGAAHRVADGISLDQAVALVTTSATGIAAAVNGQVVRRASWAATPLEPGDEIEVVTAVQGG
jgi:sulfur carrier protein